MASKKLQRSGEAQLEELSIDMSPMIDMVFLLLIFFMVNAVIIDYKKDKSIEIPIASEAKAPNGVSGRVVINVYNDETEAKNGTRFADENSNPLDEAGITELVRERKLANENSGVPKTILHLRADASVNVEYTKRAVKAAGDAEVGSVIFSTYQTQSAPAAVE